MPDDLANDLAGATIDRARPDAETYDALRLIYRETWPSTYSALLPGAALATMLRGLDEPKLDALLSNDEEIVLLARSDGQRPLGAAIARRATLDTGEITMFLWGLYVRPPWQRLGLGRRLIDAAHAQIPDAVRIDVSVLAANRPTLDFYGRLGFAAGSAELSEIMPGVTAPVVAMTKRLGNPGVPR